LIAIHHWSYSNSAVASCNLHPCCICTVFNVLCICTC